MPIKSVRAYMYQHYHAASAQACTSSVVHKVKCVLHLSFVEISCSEKKIVFGSTAPAEARQ